MTGSTLCPNCNQPIAPDEVYRAGYDTGNYRTIPPTIGRGKYCRHIKRDDAVGGSPNTLDKLGGGE